MNKVSLHIADLRNQELCRHEGSDATPICPQLYCILKKSKHSNFAGYRVLISFCLYDCLCKTEPQKLLTT